ncbi:MAG: hypothetical protein WB797_16785 [Nocardioides sp.]
MMFRRNARGADPRWELAATTQIFAADARTIVRLVREIDPGASGTELDGILMARSHPTGWFLCAVRRDDLGGDDLGHFVELVTVRSYLLLRHGPVAHVWRPGPGDGEWRSPATSLAAGLAGIPSDLGG